MSKELDDLKAATRAEMWGSFLHYVQSFFPLVTGREFKISQPMGRESHFFTISRELTKASRLEEKSIIINVPPGHGKSVMVSMWVTWTLSRWPDSQYLYISYSKSLATKHTEFIRRVIQCPSYRDLFGVHIKQDSRSKEFFQTTMGGSVRSFGSSGSITGQDAGLPNLDRFSGAIILDDMHKPDEVHSDTMRQGVIDNYRETILQRPRGPNVPIIFIGQRLHEDDLPAYMLSGNDERQYTPVIIKAIDDSGNALYPDLNSLESLREKQDKNPYVFASQYQQNPIPAGGALYKEKDFVLLDEEPDILCTFITADTAETDKSYNDATVFSFWGIYKIFNAGQDTGQLGLHWIDCQEMRIEPKDLQDAFMSFYGDCMLHRVKPLVAAIEKKSTGVTLSSALSTVRGLSIRDVKRTKASGSKTVRFLEIQPIIASKLVSFTEGACHIDTCVQHLLKITANMTHRHDDICHAAGSKIATIYGTKNVEDIKVGDKVITPFGIGTVSACGMTGYHKVINKLGLSTTPDHPVYTENGFLRLDAINDSHKIDKLSFAGLLKWRLKRRLYLMEKNILAESRENIIEVAQEVQKTKLFIGPFMNFIAEAKYRKALIFTTLTAIDLIMILKIWSCYHLANMRKSISSILKLCKNTQKNGTKAKRAKNGIGEMLWNAPLKYLKKSILDALFVIKNLLTKSLGSQQKLADCLAIPLNTENELEILPLNAQFVETSLQPRNITPNQEIEKPVRIYAEDDLVPVYALKVEKYGVYYCNGILLRNCDTLYDAVKMALIDRTLYVDHSRDKSSESVKAIANTVRQRADAYNRTNYNVGYN